MVMSVDTGILLLSALVLGNYSLHRSILYPPLSFSAVWLLVLGLYRLDLTPVDTLHAQTIGVIAYGALLFSFGGLLALLAPLNLLKMQFILTRFPPRNKIVKPAVTFFLLCGLPILLMNLISMAAGGVGNTIFQRARTGGTAGGMGSSPLGTYLILWSLYAAPLFLVEARDKYFWIMTAIAFVASILSTGRLPILMLITSLTCVHLMQENRYRFWDAIKFARIPIIIFIVLYFSLIFVTKDTSVFEDTGIGGILLLFLVGYIVGPTAALDYYLIHPSAYPEGSNQTFKFFISIASKLHVVVYQPTPGSDFITVPFPTNVYTSYRVFIGDWGIYGAVIAMGIIGLFQTLVYRKARIGSKLAMYFFAITFYATFVCIFSDEYAAFGAYIDSLLFASIYIVLRSLPLRIMPKLRKGYGFPA
jgi:oligosaccharide repeat unit polymerase